MRRSVVIAGFAGLLLAPERSAAQQTQSNPARRHPFGGGQRERRSSRRSEGLRDLGYVEGRNIIIEFRLARGLSLGPQLAAELAALPVDVIVEAASAAP
jgi:putative ABC transport system substrate-binding protein